LEKLAIYGGRPVRRKPLPPDYPGGMWIGDQEKKLVLDVLNAKSPYRYYGPKPLGMVKRLEKEFARKIGTRYALCVSSGSAALKVALAALGVGPGDEVLVPAVTFLACVGTVVTSRAIPVFVEVDKSLNMDPQDIRKKITDRTKAIMVVHLQGVPARMDEIMAIARKKKLSILEDCAQSCGASYKGVRVGSIGDMGTFSLQFNKMITSGEGGVIVTNKRALYERAVRAHDHGVIRPESGAILGVYQKDAFLAENYRMSELAGAVARAQLQKLDDIIKTLRRRSREIKKGISSIKDFEFREIPDEKGDAGVAVVFYLQSARKARLFVKALVAENIGAYQLYGGDPVYFYPQVLSKRTVTAESCPFSCPFYGKKVTYRKGLCPFSEEILARSVWIPVSSVLKDRDVRDIVRAVHKVHRGLFAKSRRQK
jgi:8-amino-3,8-dideoxy-alpha-D-manno-octulosonate transaminase